MEYLSEGVVLAALGFFGGGLLGLAARIGRFCTLGAVEDALYAADTARLRMWALAVALSIAFFFTASALGLASAETSIYATIAWNPAASVVGGLSFGYGMALAGNCGYGALARLGGGDLRSFVVVMVLAVSAYMTIGGPFAVARQALFPAEPRVADLADFGPAHALSALTGAPPLAFALAVAALIAGWALSSRRFREAKGGLFWAFVVAVAIASGWIGTSWMAQNAFDPVRAGSHSFTAPLGDTLFYLMTSTAGGPSFAVGSVAGVVCGALLGSLRKGRFRWEACDDPRELGRQIFGATLMGFGGVTALGCSVGQGMTAFSALAWSAPLTTLAIFAGAWLGLRQLIQGFSLNGPA